MAQIHHLPEPRADAFELKGRMMPLSVMRVLSADLELLREQLDAKVAKAPDLFQNFPVVLDFEALAVEAQNAFDIARLDRLLRERGFIPVGIRGADGVLSGIAAGVGIGVISPALTAAAARRKLTSETAEPSQAANLFIKEPVRSGQQIYARGGDLTVLASVSAGAEVMADGNIHVYGALRGRALAGVKGNTEARIFCRDLDAELISIAGYYRVSEKIPDADRGRPVHVRLSGNNLLIEVL